MPELPEVETITRELSCVIVGKKLNKFSVFDAKKILRPRLALPQKIVSVRRHGKYIVCEMNDGSRCLIHLRMTGELLLGRQIARRKHERARFYFHDGSTLRFVDVRRFGTIRWLRRGDNLPALGLEPLSPEFTPRAFCEVLRKTSRPIKSILLDQRFVAGIGNIYADESLWMAKIHPRRNGNGLSGAEARRLVRAIKKVLRQAIKKGGFTLRDYRRIDGRLGSYQNSRKAYAREGELCFRCGAKIKRIKVSDRSSYFCPACQRANLRT
jgi:formamidopyrimidine-DNA glycosylase